MYTLKDIQVPRPNAHPPGVGGGAGEEGGEEQGEVGSSQFFFSKEANFLSCNKLSL